MSVAERLKKQTAQALALTAEKEDLTARLEVCTEVLQWATLVYVVNSPPIFRSLFV